ncbi:MAG: peptidase S10 [Spirochaetia bacterium]|nr:peptidase S10 [Spirochaetia bacterium]
MAETEGKKEDAKAAEAKAPDYVPPKGSTAKLSVKAGGRELRYEAEAAWLPLRKDEKPKAEIFYVRYFLEGGKDRPLTFVFNGGPGASSVYLHLGALGPRRIELGPRGEPLAPPSVLVDNAETWLQFTDLVFIDPVGTGLSRMIPDPKEEEEKKKAGPEGEKDSEYWRVKRDLQSLGEFMRSFLSKYHRWESPVWLCGESYGGFRVARLARMAQEDYGIGLAGIFVVSPALEFTLLEGSDYDALMWVDAFPTMAGAAAFHGRARKLKTDEDHRAYMERAADFAVDELLSVLAAGDRVGAARRDKVLDAAADWIGLPRATMRAKYGRVTIDWFTRNLLRDEGKHLGLYDASFAVSSPFPDRDEWTGPDPTLHMLERVFAAGINTQIRAAIGLDSERDYELMSEAVNNGWKVDTRKHALETQVGATDELRYGMALNPSMKVRVSHGVYDLVTPFFSTDRIAGLLKLDADSRKRFSVRHYSGGHMFYTWKESREAFFRDAKELYGAK